jgi:hypothetical protein
VCCYLRNGVVTSASEWTLNINGLGAKPIYIKCSLQEDGSAIIDANEPYTQQLPSSDDGKIYIFLGIAYSATSVELLINHPVYAYKDGAIRTICGYATDCNVKSLTNEDIDTIMT